MIKPDKLRDLLTKTIPYFAKNPEQLQMFYANGKIWTTGATSLSYQYHYDLEIVVEDFPEHPDLLFVPVMEFVRLQQPELMTNPNKQDSITFEADPNNNATHDIYIKIPLTERVIVKQEGDHYQVHHAEEPQPTEWQAMERLTIFVKGEKVYEQMGTVE
ncbi:phage tail protein [Glaesserella parasuis]|nr:phage tail protein [Glaesserella parasuis]MCT8639150.1 phage tail protein [Glaesserella parasuis]MCT8653055.1 phage tail protein [Glaesserella parasuis]MCT8657160.1 phage tail protein [Glaesserella parasuis]MCT8659123.1 phage tail protein [Glaesserella parasuis]